MMSLLHRWLVSRFPIIWATITMILVVTVAWLVVTLNNVESCINDNLGKRNGPASNDAAAYLTFIVAVNDLFHPANPNPTPKDRERAARHFGRVVQDVKAVLIADAAEKARNPLGEC